MLLTDERLADVPSFDLDLPINCDDEYWETEDPKMRFLQPPEKPSKIAAFIAMIKLNRILSFTLRTIVRFETIKTSLS